MKPLLVIAGASGVIGRHLIQTSAANYQVLSLTRQANQPNSIQWNPKASQQHDQPNLDKLAKAISGAKAIVNLAGSSIAAGRLDKKHQQSILESRLTSTATLVEASQRCKQPPAVFFQASAVGYYGDRGENVLLEDTPAQINNTLSEISVAWEHAAQPVSTASRLLIGRFGVVIAKDAEAWQKMVLPIKLFVGGPLGHGQQWYPWVDADDVARAILYLIECPECEGVYNITAPEPIRQKDLARLTASYLKRPSLITTPAFALRILLGGVADTLLLSSAKVLPNRLLKAGFRFQTSSFEQGLKQWL